LTGTATGMEGRTGALTGARMGVPGGGGPVGEALGELSCSCWVGSDLYVCMYMYILYIYI
jgi:hypothetical protein